MSLDPTNQSQRFKPELLTRCVTYVEGWFGVSHRDVLNGTDSLPEGFRDVASNMYETLYEKENVPEETISAVGFRAIMMAQNPRPVVQERVVHLVPRVVEKVVS